MRAPTSRAGEVVVVVLREVDDRVLVGRRRVVYAQLVVVGERVDYAHGEVAGVALLAVVAEVGEFERRAAARRAGSRLPDHLVEAADAAVQVVGRVVGGEP